MKQGRALEKLVASLEKALADAKNVSVESPMRLPDRTTGSLREHDVILTINQGHHSILIAIECRDRSRPITVNQVEGFWAKCQDTGIGQGIIVSATGFYNTARKKAKHLGIRCIGIEEVDSFNWLLAPGIHAVTRRLLRNDWMFFPEVDGIVEREAFEVIDKDGNLLTQAALSANAQQQLTAFLPNLPEPVEGGEISIKFPGSNLLLRNTVSGETVPVKFAVAKIRYSVTTDLIPFSLVQYQDKNVDETITDAAYADMQIDDRTARVLIVYKEGEGGKVIMVPQKEENA